MVLGVWLGLGIDTMYTWLFLMVAKADGFGLMDDVSQYNNFPDLGDFNKNSRKETISTIFAKREYR